MLIEINENFEEQYHDILNIMKDSGFEIKEKEIILTYLIQIKKIVLVKFIITS